ncbi:MAG TPA: hypothetical protein VFW64_12280 [Pseudonocardiaceae bacterium]|nr:hypothetical protein [Pseudonocardiaceae bacterium]
MAAIPVPAVGDAPTAAYADAVANMLNALTATMLFTPAGNTDTPGAGSATWVTLGTVTVPTWASKAQVVVTCNGIYDNGTTSNVAVQLKVGTAAGVVNKRILGSGIAGQRLHLPWNDTVASLSTGAQSVTLFATFSGGSTFRADATSFFTAGFIFLP